MFSHNVSTTPSSAHQAGPLCLKCPKSFLEAKAGLGLDYFHFLPTLLPQAEEPERRLCGQEDRRGCLLVWGWIKLWEESPGASEGEEGAQGNNL